MGDKVKIRYDGLDFRRGQTGFIKGFMLVNDVPHAVVLIGDNYVCVEICKIEPCSSEKSES